jgi:hypothetical protein
MYTANPGAVAIAVVVVCLFVSSRHPERSEGSLYLPLSLHLLLPFHCPTHRF